MFLWEYCECFLINFYVCSYYTYWSAIFVEYNLFCLEKYIVIKENCENIEHHFVAKHKHFKISKSNPQFFVCCLLVFKTTVSICSVAVLEFFPNGLASNSPRPTSASWVMGVKVCDSKFYWKHINLRSTQRKENFSNLSHNR